MSAPVVTGISPKEAKPGTKLTIRGENFGLNLDDLEGVYVCGRNCLYTTEWISSSKARGVSLTSSCSLEKKNFVQ